MYKILGGELLSWQNLLKKSFLIFENWKFINQL